MASGRRVSQPESVNCREKTGFEKYIPREITAFSGKPNREGMGRPSVSMKAGSIPS